MNHNEKPLQPRSQIRPSLPQNSNLLLPIRNINLLLILLQNPFPIDLLRARSQSILRIPLLIRHHNRTDNFDPAQPTALPRLLHLLQHDLVELLVVHQRLDGVAGDAIGGREFLERGLRRHDYGDGFVAVLGGVDADVCDDVGGAVDGFELVCVSIL